MKTRKRSQPSRWDQRRQRAEARSEAYWQRKRDDITDPVDEVAVAWDRLRCALRAMDRRADNRVARAKGDGERRDAARKRERAVALTGETCARAVAYLDRLTADIKGEQ